MLMVHANNAFLDYLQRKKKKKILIKEQQQQHRNNKKNQFNFFNQLYLRDERLHMQFFELH